MLEQLKEMICEYVEVDQSEIKEQSRFIEDLGFNSYDFMINKIANLEIEPAQLALKPCSASAVVTDVNTGKVVACVSYPGYDNP